MASAEQRARRRAQRATAKALKEKKYQPRVSKAIRRAVFQGQLDYAERVRTGQEPRPDKGTPEGNELARVASYADHGKAPVKYVAAFRDYWYHDRDKGNEADIEDEADYEDEEDEE